MMNGISTHAIECGCPNGLFCLHSLLGELTDLGKQVWISGSNSLLILNWLQSTFAFGQNLRKLYVNRYAASRLFYPVITLLMRCRLRFIPDTLSNKNVVYFR